MPSAWELCFPHVCKLSNMRRLRCPQVLAAQAEGRDSARMLAPADTAYLRALVAAQAPPPPPDGLSQLLTGAAAGAHVGAPGGLGLDVWPQAPRASAWRSGPARAPGYGAAPGFPGFPAAPVLPEWPDEALLGAADGRRLFPAGGFGAPLPGAPPARGAQAAGGGVRRGRLLPRRGRRPRARRRRAVRGAVRDPGREQPGPRARDHAPARARRGGRGLGRPAGGRAGGVPARNARGAAGCAAVRARAAAPADGALRRPGALAAGVAAQCGGLRARALGALAAGAHPADRLL